MLKQSFEFSDFSPEAIKPILETISSMLSDFSISSFVLGCSFPSNLSDDEVSMLKHEFQFKLASAIEKNLSVPFDGELPDAEIIVDFNSSLVSIFIRPVFIEGKYNKFSREIAQTIYYCPKCKGRGCKECNHKGVLGLDSVQELVAEQAMVFFQASGNKFHGQGREDVDVRMLGSGRSFVLELIEPKKRVVDVSELEKAINSFAKGKISVSCLSYCSKSRIAELKESRARKLYLATATCSLPLSSEQLASISGRKLEIKQRTPNRVSKRRSDLVRERTCSINSAKLLSSKEFQIEIDAEAGLYIKELISGDSGRTNPSISSVLGDECVCSELDVLEILEN